MVSFFLILNVLCELGMALLHEWILLGCRMKKEEHVLHRACSSHGGEKTEMMEPWDSSSSYCIFPCCCRLVTKSYPTLCDPMDCSVSGFPVLHCLPEFTQTYVHWVDDAMQTSHPVTPFSSCPQFFPLHSSWFCWWQESQRENTVYSLWKHRKPLSLAHVCLMFVSSRGTYLAFIRFC